MMTWPRYLRLAGVLLALTLVDPGHAVEYLYYSSPGDSLFHYAGMWGGPVGTGVNGTSEDLRRSGFHCAYMYDGGFNKGLGIKGMFLDPLSKRVIMDLTVPYDNRVSVIEGPVCTETPECSANDLGPVTVYFTLGENTDPVKSAQPGPFAMWNSSIYFVVQRWNETSVDSRILQHQLELRQLAGCEDRYPFTIRKKFDINQCSLPLAILYENTAQLDEETFKTADHLYIIERSDGELVFLTQIFNWTRSEENNDVRIGMTLLAAETSGTVRKLHHTSLPASYYKAKLVETGGLSWRDGILCWSSLEVIKCARWNGYGDLSDVRTVLKPGQASQVCVDTQVYENHENVTTGVALANTSDGISLYFGCAGGEPVSGGAGFLRVSAAGTSMVLEPVTDRHGVIFAGSMFMTDVCDINPKLNDEVYNWGTKPPVTGGGTPRAQLTFSPQCISTALTFLIGWLVSRS